MVVFGCSACGESLRKQQVEKHGYKCAMPSLSCFDCFKDFDRKTYAVHFTCKTEEERVQGGLYKPKENKTGIKRDAWNDCVAQAAENNSDPKIKKILSTIQIESNIPMKLNPFKNFLRNKKVFLGDIAAENAFKAAKELYDASKSASASNSEPCSFDYKAEVQKLLEEHPDGIEAAEAFRMVIVRYREKVPESTGPQQIVDKLIPLFTPHVGSLIIC